MDEDAIKEGEIVTITFEKALQELLTSVGKRLRDIRVQKGMTQRDASDESGISDVYISGVERGSRNPTVERVCRLAYAYGHRVLVLIATDEDIEVVVRQKDLLRQQEVYDAEFVRTLRDLGVRIDAVLRRFSGGQSNILE